MPNWTENHLTIKVPTDKRDALLQALAGPADWAVPDTPDNFFNRVEPLSAHQEIAWAQIMDDSPAGQERRAQLIAEFRAHEAASAQARPEWMPVSMFEVQNFWRTRNAPQDNTNDQSAKVVAFSVAKLMPWKDRAEFDEIFPGEVDKFGFWSPRKDAEQAYNSGRRGYIALRNDRIGVKWPPSEIELHDHDTRPEGYSLVLITYNTPWSPMSNLGGILGPVLAAHDAQAIMVWKEEDHNSGWSYIDPGNGIDAENSFEHGSHTDEAPDEDDPEYTTREWNDESLIDSVLNEIESYADGADFIPRLL